MKLGAFRHDDTGGIAVLYVAFVHWGNNSHYL